MAIIGVGLDDQSFSSDESYGHLFLESEGPTVKGLYFQRGRILRGPEASRPILDPYRQALINVGGVRYSFPWSTLEEFPESRLSRLRSCTNLKEIAEFCDDYDSMRHEFFFDRDPFAFRTIFCFLVNGKLRVLQDVCSVALHTELLYWGIDLNQMMPCCRHRVVNYVENVAQHQRKEKEWRERRKAMRACVVKRSLFYKLGEVVDNPDSGLAGKVFACLSVIMVVVTVLSLCIGTMLDGQQEGSRGECLQQCRSMFLIETVCVMWFTLELLVRFFHAHSKLEFIRGPLNITDVAAISPYYISLFLELRDETVHDIVAEGGKSTLDKLGLILRVLRALRVLYVVRLARHSMGLQTLGLTIQRSFTDFGLLLLFVCVSVALFSPLVHLIESELAPNAAKFPHLSFSSIPASYWWTIISVTTVGYGDMVPFSTLGQLMALIVILLGILILSFPSTSIFHTFNCTYTELREERKRQHKEEMDAELITEMEESLKERDTWPDNYSQTDFLPGLEDPQYLFMTDIKVLAKSTTHQPLIPVDQNLM
ncbi:potassium voltage-gated channel subfamily G member 2-like [Amphiprion ocellaris]|uniref:Potassium voltage-gated channel, subfamily G, member 4b n=1 Tax=Amphiprion ocellaris TaxID=80972 RepID=A0A3Q1AH21_AMPOC|nr:potassium voltage-gated channel subfamily G member 2-like [Amphiprion ocellaris]